MPIREYRCAQCGSKFESLVFSADEEKALRCPKCHSEDLARCMSVCAVRVSDGNGGACRDGAGGSGCGECLGGNCVTCRH